MRQEERRFLFFFFHFHFLSVPNSDAGEPRGKAPRHMFPRRLCAPKHVVPRRRAPFLRRAPAPPVRERGGPRPPGRTAQDPWEPPPLRGPRRGRDSRTRVSPSPPGVPAWERFRPRGCCGGALGRGTPPTGAYAGRAPESCARGPRPRRRPSATTAPTPERRTRRGGRARRPSGTCGRGTRLRTPRSEREGPRSTRGRTRTP